MASPNNAPESSSNSSALVVASAEISPSTAQPPAPVTTSSPLSRVLAVYPFQRELVQYLNQHDLSVLRGTCKAIREALPSTSARLGGHCQFIFPAPGTQVGTRCHNGPSYRGALKRCEGSRHGFEHDDGSQNFWICETCADLGSTGVGVWTQEIDQLVGHVPICEECVRKSKHYMPASVLFHVSEDCRCRRNWEHRFEEHPYCVDCQNSLWDEAREQIRVREAELEQAVASAGQAGSTYTCVRCVKTLPLPLRDREGPMVFCLGCSMIGVDRRIEQLIGDGAGLEWH